MLAFAGTVLFMAGYFLGSRYFDPFAEPSPLVLLPEMPAPEGFELRAGDGRRFGPADLQDQWQLLIPYRADRSECGERVRHVIRLRNELAARPELQRQLHLLFIRTVGEPTASDALTIPDGHPAIQTLDGDPAAIEPLLRQIGLTDAHQRHQPCRSRAPYSLIDADARLRALVPVSLAPETAAEALARLMSDG